jgi:hypothetical protein
LQHGGFKTPGMATRLLFFAFALLAASPALANSAAQVPEGSNLTLFALGIAGVLIGRRASTRHKPD